MEPKVFSGSLLVQEMAKQLFINKMSTIQLGVLVADVLQIQEECYFIARVFYGECTKD